MSMAGEVTIPAAVAVGAVSFLSPCVLPLVPGYLSTISGVGIAELRDSNRSTIAAVLGPSIVFCLSFTIVFVALGMTATGLGALLQDNRAVLNRVAGALIILMGVYFLAVLVAPKLNRTWHPDALLAKAGAGGPVIAGAAFAIAWTPCIGPTLAAILAAASTQDSVGRGALLLAFYSAGLAIPFLAAAVAFNRATRAFAWMRRRYVYIAGISGVIMIAMGALVFTDSLYLVNAEFQRWFDAVGVNVFSL